MFCPACTLDLPESAFWHDKTSKTGFAYRCIECWYKMPSQTREKRRERRAIIKRRNQDYVLTYLVDHPCIDCDEPDPIVLQFDHREQASKTRNLTEMMRGTRSLEAIQKEIDKCDVRCANCHARRTAKQFGWYKGAV